MAHYLHIKYKNQNKEVFMRKWYYAGSVLLIMLFIGATMPKRLTSHTQKDQNNQTSIMQKKTTGARWSNPAGGIHEVGHGFVLPKTSANASIIAVHNVVFDTKIGEPRIPDGLRATHIKGGENYYIIKCNGPILESYKRKF